MELQSEYSLRVTTRRRPSKSCWNLELFKRYEGCLSLGRPLFWTAFFKLAGRCQDDALHGRCDLDHVFVMVKDQKNGIGTSRPRTFSLRPMDLHFFLTMRTSTIRIKAIVTAANISLASMCEIYVCTPRFLARNLRTFRSSGVMRTARD